MPCISSPELNEAQLMAFLDGEGDKEVTAHIERCASCRGRAEHLAGLQETLRHRLFRAACPTSLEVGEYHLGVLTPVRAEAVARHIAECPHCAREIAGLRGYLSELAPELTPNPLARIADRAADRVTVLVARLAGGAADPASPGVLAPAYAGSRGDDDPPLVYEIDDVQVVIQVEKDRVQPESRSLLGLVIGMGDEGDVTAHLWRETERVAQVPVDELGNFAFSDLSTGEYDLFLQDAGMEIHIQRLDVGTHET